MSLEHFIGYTLSGIGIGVAMNAGKSRAEDPDGWRWMLYAVASIPLMRFGWFLVDSK